MKKFGLILSILSPVKPISYIAVAIILMALLLAPQDSHAQFQLSGQAPQTTGAPKTVVDITLWPDESKLKAKHILVTNLTTGQVLYDKKSTDPQPLASLAKLMTAVTVKEIYNTWVNPPERIQLVAKSAAYTEADREVSVGGRMKTNDLLSYMLLSSSNFAAQSLATGIMPYSSFMSYMNFISKKAGLASSNFVNASGLTEKNGANSSGTAEDVMKTLDIIVKKYPELARATRSEDAVIKTSSGKNIFVDNTNKSLAKIPDVFLGKTGYTDEAGGNLAIVVKKNENYYGIVVMGSTIEGRFSDAEYLESLISSAVGSVPNF